MVYQKMLPCPFCGMQSEADWDDTLYSSGVAWRDDVGIVDDITPFRHYVSRNDPRGYHGLCYEVNCAQNYGGCGAEISGDSAEEAIEKWNRRITKE